MTAVCSRCGERPPTIDKNGRKRRYCRPCTNEYQREWNRKHPGSQARAHRKQHLKRTYGITTEEYDAMLEKQGGVCAVCGSTNTQRRGSSYFHIDHDHDTGKVRGLLCGLCNKGLGCFRDDLQTLQWATDYLGYWYVRLSEREAAAE